MVIYQKMKQMLGGTKKFYILGGISLVALITGLVFLRAEGITIYDLRSNMQEEISGFNKGFIGVSGHAGWDITKTGTESDVEVSYLMFENKTTFCLTPPKGYSNIITPGLHANAVPVTITNHDLLGSAVNTLDFSTEKEVCFDITYDEFFPGMSFKVGWNSIVFNSTGVSEGTGQDSWGKRTFYSPLRDRWYQAFINNQGAIQMDSSADGVNWDVGVHVNNTAHANNYTYDDFDCYIDDTGTYIHCTYAQSYSNTLYYRPLVTSPSSPYIAAGNEDTPFTSADGNDDVENPKITLDYDSCVLIAFDMEDDSQATADEHNVVLIKEDAGTTCGNGDFDAADMETGFPIYNVSDYDIGYSLSCQTGIYSYPESTDAEIFFTCQNDGDNQNMSSVFFNGTSNTIQPQRIIQEDLNGGYYQNDYSSVIFNETSFLAFAAEDGTSNIDAHQVTQKNGSVVSDVDTLIDTQYASTSGRVTSFYDSIGDDVWVIASDDSDQNDIYVSVSDNDHGITWDSFLQWIDEAGAGGAVRHITSYFDNTTCTAGVGYVATVNASHSAMFFNSFNTGTCDSCTGGNCEFYAHPDLLFDARIQDAALCLNCDEGGIIKWDISEVCGLGVNIDNASLQFYVDNIQGAPDADIRFWYIRNQTIDDSNSAAEWEAETLYNSTNSTFAPTVAGYANITITDLVTEACNRGENLTLRYEDPDYTVNSIAAFSGTSNVNNMGHVQFGSNNYRALRTYEWAFFAFPKLFVTYSAQELNVTLNETITPDNSTIDWSDGFYAEWYAPEGETLSACKFEIQGPYGTTNYTGTLTNNNCSLNLTTYLPTNVLNFRAWANDSDGTEGFSKNYYVNVTPRTEGVDGIWYMRAPINSSNQYSGASEERLHGPTDGNGHDMGVLWRGNRSDVNGEFFGDESRYCASWVQFYFDEPGYNNVTIDHIQCQTWFWSSNMHKVRGALSGNASIEGYDESTNSTTWIYYNETQTFNDFNATYYHFFIWNESNLDKRIDNQGDLLNLSMKYRSYDDGDPGIGYKPQNLIHANQRGWCIVNKVGSSWLNDTATLNSTDEDGDGLTDWQEVYRYYTDPYDPDTDNDTHNDYQEVANGKDGLDPYDWGVIHKFYATNATVNISLNNLSYQTVEPTVSDANVTLAYTDLNKSLLAAFDGENFDPGIIQIKGNDTHTWAISQLNYHVNLSGYDVGSITTINVFEGGSTSGNPATQGHFTTFNETALIYNASNNENSVIMYGMNDVNMKKLKQIRSGFGDYLDPTTTFSVTRTNKYEYGDQDFTWNFYPDWFEIWVITGESELNITYPTTENNFTYNSSNQWVVVNFTFIEDGIYMTEGVSVVAIPVNSPATNATLNGIATYAGNNIWQQNCTLPPNLPRNHYYNLTVIAQTGTSGLVSDTEEDAIFYDQGSCVYPGSGAWRIKCSDHCIINTATNLMGNPILVNETGSLTFNASITNVSYFLAPSATCRKEFIKPSGLISMDGRKFP